MIRLQTDSGWILIRHQDHARLAGEFAACWGNDRFLRPEPFPDIHVGVSRHDDAWVSRDDAPAIAADGTPSAFSRELVGTYSAFENIDLEAYLRVRGEATEAVAKDNPLAAILVSMHTVNLLTEQADLTTLSPMQREVLAAFVRAQLARQEELKSGIADGKRPSEIRLEQAFRFLQACDSLSLAACVRYPGAMPLRHRHPTKSDGVQEITCYPEGGDRYRLEPYPLDSEEITFTISGLVVDGFSFASDAALRAACGRGTVEALNITVHK